jgi:TadE-like protein
MLRGRSVFARPSGPSCFNRRGKQRGQALVETVLTLPVLVILIFGVFSTGVAMYSGYQAASAIREPVMDKLKLGQTSAPITKTYLLPLVNSSGGNKLDTGSNLDGLEVKAGKTALNQYLVGKKTYTSPFPFLPAFTFNAVQPIDTKLVAGNVGTSYQLTYQPVGFTPTSPAYYGININSNPSLGLTLNPDCNAVGTLTLATALGATDPGGNTAFGVPAANPSAGKVPANTTSAGALYIPSAQLESLAAIPNNACDAKTSIDAWTSECGASYDAANVETIYTVTGSTTGATYTCDPGAAADATAAAACVKEAGTTATVAPATAAYNHKFGVWELSGKSYTCNPDTAADATAAAACEVPATTTLTPVVSTSEDVPKEDAPDKGTTTNACVLAKQRSCRLYYVNQMAKAMADQLKARGYCSGVSKAESTTFKN